MRDPYYQEQIALIRKRQAEIARWEERQNSFMNRYAVLPVATGFIFTAALLYVLGFYS
jgi:sorbitol-specific phosphotransferase system component IIC